MPTVIINDESVESQIGERLLDTARRDAAHIGFVCDGNGLCQMCECVVLKGGDHLSPPNQIERIWLTEDQLEYGTRLACQVSVRGPGPVEVLTRAERLRREAIDVISPPPGTNVGENLGRLVNDLLRINVDHVERWPFNMLYALSNTLAVQFSLNNLWQIFGDTIRITTKLLRSDRVSVSDVSRTPPELQSLPKSES